MALPLFTFLTPAKSIPLPGELVSEGPHEHAKRAIDRLYRIPEGHVILTLWKSKLHCVTYQAPLEDETASESRNAGLFAHYGEGKVWNEILDNGFGKTYRREDMERFALWSFAMDYNTFGTMAFHEVMWGS